MKLLGDKELLEYVENNQDKLVSGLTLTKDPYSKDSPVQPSSIDLHVGKIYLPETDADEPGGAENPKIEHILKVGGTAIIATEEEMDLPANIAAFGFPPTEVSTGGILMTNPGHIDPGYKGALHFTVINMGKDIFSIHAGARIVSLLFVKLAEDVKEDYSSRQKKAKGSKATESTTSSSTSASESSSSSTKPSVDSSPTKNAPPIKQLNRLGKDFLRVKKRARRIAKTATEDAVKEVQIWGAGVSIFITALATIIVALIGQFRKDESLKIKSELDVKIAGLQAEVKVLREEVEAAKIEDRIQNLEETLEPFQSFLKQQD